MTEPVTQTAPETAGAGKIPAPVALRSNVNARLHGEDFAEGQIIENVAPERAAKLEQLMLLTTGGMTRCFSRISPAGVALVHALEEIAANAPKFPPLVREEIVELRFDALQKLARERGIAFAGVKKVDLIEDLLADPVPEGASDTSHTSPTSDTAQ